MAVSLYSTQELLEVQQRLQNLPDGFWRNRYTRVITSDREEILFEVADRDNRKLAPFVAPNVQGRVMRGQGYEARTFRPAYVKPKHIVDPTKAIPRMMGEPIMGGMSMAARFDAVVANNMRLELESIQRRWDWMACRATVDGFVLVEGDDYPSTLVDFGARNNILNARTRSIVQRSCSSPSVTQARSSSDLAHGASSASARARTSSADAPDSRPA